jgi:DNA invertase Pin-like site-specific DNA recombinase
MSTRVLFAERISDDKATSLSIEGQHRKLTERATERDVEVVGDAVDRSVSGDVDLPDRPALRDWLTEEGRERWDELWVTTQDRLSRNDLHFLAFVFRILEWGKTLVVLDDPGLDLTTSEGRLVAHDKAYAPAKELERIKARCQDSHAYRRHTVAWPGGVPPYGYVTADERAEGGKVHRVLVLDEYAAAVLHEVRRWLVDQQETLQGAAGRLNERAELTVSDRWRQMHGKPLGSKRNGWQPERWSASGLYRTLTSPACQGVKQHRGKPIHNRDGTPLTITAPVFDHYEWETLQSAIARRRNATARRNGASPLLGVAFCGECLSPAYRAVIHKQAKGGERVHSYYRCSRAHGGEKRCPGVSIAASILERGVEKNFLEARGDQRVTRKRFVKGSDVSTELNDVEKRIARLREDRELGAYDDDPSYYAERMKEYTARRNQLQEQPQTPSHWEDVEQTETYSDIWGDADQETRRQLLLDAGIRVEVLPGGTFLVIGAGSGTEMGDTSRARVAADLPDLRWRAWDAFIGPARALGEYG